MDYHQNARLMIRQRAQLARKVLNEGDIKRLARIVKPGRRITGDRTRETRGMGYEYLHIAIRACPERSRRGHSRINHSLNACASRSWPGFHLGRLRRLEKIIYM